MSKGAFLFIIDRGRARTLRWYQPWTCGPGMYQKTSWTNQGKLTSKQCSSLVFASHPVFVFLLWVSALTYLMVDYELSIRWKQKQAFVSQVAFWLWLLPQQQQANEYSFDSTEVQRGKEMTTPFLSHVEVTGPPSAVSWWMHIISTPRFMIFAHPNPYYQSIFLAYYMIFCLLFSFFGTLHRP